MFLNILFFKTLNCGLPVLKLVSYNILRKSMDIGTYPLIHIKLKHVFGFVNSNRLYFVNFLFR